VNPSRPRRKTPSARKTLAALPLLLAALVFSRCELYGKVGGDGANIEGALPWLLQGEWAYIPPHSDRPSEVYTITAETISYGYAGEDNTGTNYAGKIRFVSNYSAGSGVIIIEYTEKPSYALYNGLPFFAVYYRNLNEDWVQLANAVNPDQQSAPDTATLEEAVAKFTRMNMGNFVSWPVVQPQRRIR
jgi:hypothetical protein